MIIGRILIFEQGGKLSPVDAVLPYYCNSFAMRLLVNNTKEDRNGSITGKKLNLYYILFHIL
jgi:hypothetical protein